jgi:hypothetical protein
LCANHPIFVFGGNESVAKNKQNAKKEEDLGFVPSEGKTRQTTNAENGMSHITGARLWQSQGIE